jgi:hypothetical protein
MLSPHLLDLLRTWWRAAHLVAGGAAAGLAVPGPRSGPADDHAPAQSRREGRRRRGPEQCARQQEAAGASMSDLASDKSDPPTLDRTMPPLNIAFERSRIRARHGRYDQRSTPFPRR